MEEVVVWSQEGVDGREEACWVERDSTLRVVLDSSEMMLACFLSLCASTGPHKH